jgi:hypothetical protein
VSDCSDDWRLAKRERRRRAKCASAEAPRDAHEENTAQPSPAQPNAPTHREALDRAEPAHGRLGREAEEGDHCEARVLDLLEPHLGRQLAERVERVHPERAALARALPPARAHALEHREERDADGELSLGVERVGGGLRVGPPGREADEVGEQDAGDGGHRPAAVGQLRLGVVGEEVRVGPKAEGVEACGSGEEGGESAAAGAEAGSGRGGRLPRAP